MIELTDVDRAAIEAVWSARSVSSSKEVIEGIYIAGMKVMAERCAVACEHEARFLTESHVHWKPLHTCAAACRALAKEGNRERIEGGRSNADALR